MVGARLVPIRRVSTDHTTTRSRVTASLAAKKYQSQLAKLRLKPTRGREVSDGRTRWCLHFCQEEEAAMRPTVGEILADHVSLEVSCVDRIYVNGYVPKLQTSGQLVYFLSEHLGNPLASPALPGRPWAARSRSAASVAGGRPSRWSATNCTRAARATA
jgi:hypothetical protein